jgi:hypothetical protein
MPDLTVAIRNLQRLKAEIQTIAGSEMVNTALDNIRKGVDYLGSALKPRSAKAKRNKGRAILVDTGTGRRSIRYMVSGQFVNITAVDYMIAHNEGVSKTVTVRAHTRGRYQRSRVTTGTFSVKTRKENTKTVKSRTGDISIRAHAMKMNLPTRKFFGNSAAMIGRINATIGNRIIKALT